MPLNKSAFYRYRLLDECFQRKHHIPSSSQNTQWVGYWHISDLMKYIEEKTDKGISEKMLRNDIRALREDFGAPIHSEKNIGYAYSEPFSIFENPLRDDDYKILNEIIEILKNYSGFKYFDEADTIISKLEENRLHKDFYRIQLDTLPGYVGLEYITPLKNAIFDKKPISLTYKEFDREVVQLVYHPYILKEYNNRWFVLGYAEKTDNAFGKIWLFALDRILKIQPGTCKYIKPEKDIITRYFYDIFGVTNYKEREPEKVIIRVKKFRSNYIKTKPIHASQKLIREDIEFDDYGLKLKLNNEIISHFLSFGEDLAVIEPSSFIEEIKRHIATMYHQYQ